MLSALSFNGTLNGSEYLKKFIQLPIRLPRLSRKLLKDYIVSAVESLISRVTPSLSKGELKEIVDASTDELALKLLVTPRDVVRHLNMFMMRLTDCRNEVNLGDLFRFVALDLLCPDAIDIIRNNSGFFITTPVRTSELWASSVREVDLLFEESSTNRTSRPELFEVIDLKIRELVITLVDTLFPSRVSDEGAIVTRASTSVGLVKLLFGGMSPLTFSVTSAREFLTGTVDPLPVIDDIVRSGLFSQWLVFLSSITPFVSVNRPELLASCLAERAGAAAKQEQDRLNNVIRLTGSYIFEVISNLPAGMRFDVANYLVSEQAHLYVSEQVLVELSRNCGIWENGVSKSVNTATPPISTNNVLSAGDVFRLQQKWIGVVRVAAERNTLHKESGLASILFRWGQFARDDYREAQAYVTRFSSSSDPLLILQYFPISVDTSSLEKLFPDPAAIIVAIEERGEDSQLKKIAIDAMQAVQRRLTGS